MTASPPAITDNAAWAGARPALSVLIPFKGDDPCPLLAALDRETAAAEVVLLDDGSGDEDLAARAAAAIMRMRLPARLIRLAENEGRAKGRNRLAGHARADFLLFLDSDMLPDSPDFLDRWIRLARDGGAPVVFGGFTLDQAPRRPEHALHRAMALRSDCLDAHERRRLPEKHVFTSNLLVRRDVFAAEPFDEGFSGWGWEDVEWGMRVARRWPIGHEDNTATHLGLDSAEVLARKYEQSAGNFARIVAAHPALLAQFPSFKVASLLKRAPLRGLWRPLLKRLALSERAPLGSRALAMRLYRAALYAETI